MRALSARKRLHARTLLENNNHNFGARKTAFAEVWELVLVADTSFDSFSAMNFGTHCTGRLISLGIFLVCSFHQSESIFLGIIRFRRLSRPSIIFKSQVTYARRKVSANAPYFGNRHLHAEVFTKLLTGFCKPVAPATYKLSRGVPIKLRSVCF